MMMMMMHRRRQTEMTDAEQELRDMTAAGPGLGGGGGVGVYDSYCTSRRVQRCDSGPAKYTVAVDQDDELDPPRGGCTVHRFTTTRSVDTSCSSGAVFPPLVKSSSGAGGPLGTRGDSLAATLTARYLDQ